MNDFFRDVFSRRASRTYVYVSLCSLLLAVSILYDVLVPGLAAVALLFHAFRKSFGLDMRHRLAGVFVGNLVLMNALTFWFKDIDAAGWDKIWIAPPYLWLLASVFLATVLCSLAAAALFWMFYKLLPRLSKQRLYIMSYYFALAMMLSEIIRGLAFSAIVHHSHAPIEPVWNLYSIAQLAATNDIGLLGRTLGFWGLVFALYAAGALAYSLANLFIFHQRLAGAVRSFIPLAVLGLVLILLCSVKSGNVANGSINAVAVHQGTSEGDYLERLRSQVVLSGSAATIVVLPEYSNLFHPYANSSVPTLNTDSRYSIPDTFTDKNIYFSGTEDEYTSDARYVESYLANGSLKKVKREVKTFLIPGGEYIIGWVASAINATDPDSAARFASSRSRSVIRDTLEPETHDTFADKVGIGACSTVLMPYHFRKQAASGAVVFASNVSYEQFQRAPQYEIIASRFAQLNAKMSNRPFIIGARDGAARIYDSSGTLIARTDSELYVQAELKVDSSKNIYVLLGDSLLVFILLIPMIGTIGYGVLKNLKKRR